MCEERDHFLKCTSVIWLLFSEQQQQKNPTKKNNKKFEYFF